MDKKKCNPFHNSYPNWTFQSPRQQGTADYLKRDISIATATLMQRNLSWVCSDCCIHSPFFINEWYIDIMPRQFMFRRLHTCCKALDNGFAKECTIITSQPSHFESLVSTQQPKIASYHENGFSYHKQEDQYSLIISRKCVLMQSAQPNTKCTTKFQCDEN